MTAIQVTAMTADEARASIERIKTGLENIRAELFSLKERDGWEALGYASFQECVQKEFQMSVRHAHRLLNAYAVDRILAAPWQESSAFFGKHATSGNGPIGPPEPVARIEETHARELTPLIARPETLREVYAEVVEQTGGKPTATDIRAAVGRHMEDERTPSLPPFVMPEMEQESEEEKAYYAMARHRLVVRFDPSTVADAATRPDAALPGFEEFEAWFSSFMTRLRANAASPVRAVR